MDIKNKKIFLYMNFFKNDKSIGITKKICAQIRTMRRMGLDVTYTSYTKDGVVIVDNNEHVVFYKNFEIPFSNYKRFYRRFLLISAVTEFFEERDKNFDLVYLRWHTFDKKFLKMLKTMNISGAKCIIEAHAWTPNLKGRTIISKYQIAMDRRYSKYAKDYVSLVAGMSEYENIWGIKTVKIDNAVDLDNISERHWLKDDNVLRIISVSNECSYHGYDRLLKGLRLYYDNGGQQKIKVYLVGVFLESTKNLVDKLKLSDSVDFLGKKFGKELDDIYDNSDLGIGALAHHRIGMYAGSSLKTKEYFAKGLPFIYGWKEPAFDENYPYALRVELCEEPIDINKLIDFYNSIKNDKDMLKNMREFALHNYSWENELNKVFAEL